MKGTLNAFLLFVAFITAVQAKDEDYEGNVGLAFGLVAAAGLSTTFGAAMVFCDYCFQTTNHVILGAALGFSGGVMIYVSFVEIFQKSLHEFENCDCLWEDEEDDAYPAAYTMSTVCFFVGIMITYSLDFIVHIIFHLSGNAHGHSHELPSPPNEPHSHSHGHGHEACEKKKESVPVHEPQHSLIHENGIAASPMSRQLAKNIVDSYPNMFDRDTIEARGHLHQNHHGKTKVQRSQSVPILTERASTFFEIQDAPFNPQHSTNHNIIQQSSGNETESESTDDALNDARLHQMGIMTAVAIGLHNFPEGLATFVATLADPTVGVALAVAIAIHNIPEGLCVAIPVYYSTGSRWQGFWIAFWSGVSELIGAALGYAFLRRILGPAAYGSLFGVVAGMMVTIVLKELIPTAHRYDKSDRFATKFVFVGCGVMALSLVLFQI